VQGFKRQTVSSAVPSLLLGRMRQSGADQQDRIACNAGLATGLFIATGAGAFAGSRVGKRERKKFTGLIMIAHHRKYSINEYLLT
jgi:hypothetical protein